MNDGSATRVWNDEHRTPYAYKLDQWVGYDDEESLTVKVKFDLVRKWIPSLKDI